MGKKVRKEVFIDWKYDFGFKWIFGRESVEKNFLSLVKAIADEAESEFIKIPHEEKKLNYLSVERLYQKDENIKKIFYDIFAELPDKTRIILEMQKFMHQGFDTRMVDYLIKGVNEQNRVHVLIAILDFNFILSKNDDKNEMIKKYRFIVKGEIITVNLERFKKNESELKSDLDKWLYLIKNIEKLKEVPEIFIGTPFQKLIEMSRITALPKPALKKWQKELLANEYLQEGITHKAQDLALIKLKI